MQVVETVDVGGGRNLPLTIITPDGDSPPDGWPGVIVLYEAFGMQPDIVRAAERFTSRGWAAVIPDFLAVGNSIKCLVGALREIGTSKPGPFVQLAVASGKHLGARADVDEGRIAVIGFCLGGGLALLAGTVEGSGIKAVAANYADIPKKETLRTSAPVVGAYGKKDLWLRTKGKKLHERLDACGVANDIKTYDNAGHSFMTDGKHPVAKYTMIALSLGEVPDASKDAWDRVFIWLDTHVA